MAEEPVAPLVEREVALDIVQRGLLIAPVVILVAGLAFGWDGAASAAIGLGIVLVNFLAAAAIMTRAAKSGPTAIGAAALGGYVLRLAVILIALVLLRHQPWIDLADARLHDRRNPPRVAGLGNEVRESHARCAGVEAGTTFRRPMNALLLAVDVPPISHVTIWGSGPLGINRTVAIYVFATLATILLFWLGTRKKDALVPSGFLQNTAESGIGFVRNQVIMATMGTDGLGYLPYLSALFFFIFFSNITEIIPAVQFPANARLGMPLVLALVHLGDLHGRSASSSRDRGTS